MTVLSRHLTMRHACGVFGFASMLAAGGCAAGRAAALDTVDVLCGLPHTDKTRGWLAVEDAVAFRAWIRVRTRRGQK